MGTGQIALGKVKTRMHRDQKIRRGEVKEWEQACLSPSSLHITKELRVSVWEDEEVPEMDGSDGCTIWINLTPPNCTNLVEKLDRLLGWMEILVQIVRLYPLGGRLYFPNITAGISPATHAPLWWILSPLHHHQRWSPFSSLSNCDQYNMVEDHDITSQPGQTRPYGFPQHSGMLALQLLPTGMFSLKTQYPSHEKHKPHSETHSQMAPVNHPSLMIWTRI